MINFTDFQNDFTHNNAILIDIIKDIIKKKEL